ncbi:MAG: hypothetical protein H6697_10565 [Myxococcales bacterium]|nr:hypothetical protein [Myxococcales bacterium]
MNPDPTNAAPMTDDLRTKTPLSMRLSLSAMGPTWRALVGLALAAVAVGTSACSGEEPRGYDDGGGMTTDATDVGDSGADGTDAPLCAAPRVACGDGCVDLLSNDAHCGRCDSACGDTESCEDGVCGCAAPLERCGAQCVELSSDAAHCGRCGASCGGDERCVAGECVVDCDDGETACRGECVDTQTSAEHCGACDRPCAGADNEVAECDDGTCHVACRDGFVDLDHLAGCEYACRPDSAPAVERCDGRDNDCDGDVDDADDDYVADACPLQAGVCAGALYRCEDGAPAGCEAVDYAAVAAPLPFDGGIETWCDGADNNCSGLADELCCAPVDLPIAVDVSGPPLGWDEWHEVAVIPLFGVESPTAVTVAVARVGGESRRLVSLATWDEAGGVARYTTLLNAPFAADMPSIFDAAFVGDEVVVYSESADGGIARMPFGLDGTPGEATEIGSELLGGAAFSVLAEATARGRELLAVLVSESGANRSAWGRVLTATADGTWHSSGDVSVDADNLSLVGLTQTSEAIVVCVDIPAFLPSRLACVVLDSGLGVAGQTSLAAAPPFGGRQRFVVTAGGARMFVPSVDLGGVLALDVAPDGTATVSDTGLRTSQGFAMTAVLPSGDVGVLTATSDGVVEGAELVRTSLTRPSAGTGPIASYLGPSGLPYGAATSGDAAFVLIAAADEADPGTPSRVRAFRLSRDGAALCVEE